MCLNSCVTYTGPYMLLESCPRCGTSRYIPGTRRSCKHFSTIPIRPVIQAFYASLVTAKHMHYLGEKLEENLAGARLNSGRLNVYDDTSCGQALLDAWDSQVLFQFLPE